MSECVYCGPICYGGAAHNARAEDGALYEPQQAPSNVIAGEQTSERISSERLREMASPTWRFVSAEYREACYQLVEERAENKRLRSQIASVRREAQEEIRDVVRGAQDEATWQRIQGDEYGSY